MAKFTLILITSFVLGFTGSVLETPVLGVATDSGIHSYSNSEALTDENINYFAKEIVPAVNDFYHGFIVRSFDSMPTVVPSFNPSLTRSYLLSNAVVDNFPFAFDGITLSEISFDKDISKYKPSRKENRKSNYYGFELASIPGGSNPEIQSRSTKSNRAQT